MEQVRNGAMAAIGGLTATRIGRILEDNGLARIDIANFNSPSQTVISGPEQDINRAAAVFEAAGACTCRCLSVGRSTPATWPKPERLSAAS